MSKQEFAKRLKARMTNKRMTQADLARATGLSRNNISTYVRAACFPSPRSLGLLVQALDCKIEDLVPVVEQKMIRGEMESPLEFTTSVADPSRGWLHINQLVSTTIGIEILKLLDADRIAHE